VSSSHYNKESSPFFYVHVTVHLYIWRSYKWPTRCNFLCSFIDSKTLYMFWASLAHHQELRNCVCSLWYCHVDLCNDG